MRNKIAVVLVGIGLLFGSKVNAQMIRLAWDPYLFQGVTNFTLYAATNAFTAAPTNPTVRVNTGTNLSATIDSLLPGKWWFAVAPMKAGVEWGISPVVMVEAAPPALNMRIVVIPYSLLLTNDYDVGFFRLRFP